MGVFLLCSGRPSFVDARAIGIVGQVRDGDNPTSLILAETLLGLDFVFLSGESQQFLESPLTFQIWLMERLDMIATPTDTKCQIESNWVKFLDKKSNISIRWNCYWWKCPPHLLWSLGSDHIFLVGLRRATFYKADRLLRQFQYEHGMLRSRGRKPFTPVDTTLTSVRNMLLGLDMADWVDQSFVKVYFYKMTVEYSNWLVGKIRDKETNMASMRK